MADTSGAVHVLTCTPLVLHLQVSFQLSVTASVLHHGGCSGGKQRHCTVGRSSSHSHQPQLTSYHPVIAHPQAAQVWGLWQLAPANEGIDATDGVPLYG